MILANHYGYKRVSDYSAQASVFNHKGELIEQKTDLPVIALNWINGQMISREHAAVPISEMTSQAAQEAEAARAAQEAREAEKPPLAAAAPVKPAPMKANTAKKKTKKKAK